MTLKYPHGKVQGDNVVKTREKSCEKQFPNTVHIEVSRSEILIYEAIRLKYSCLHVGLIAQVIKIN